MNKSASLAIAAFAASAARLCLADAPVFAAPFTAHAVLQRDCAVPEGFAPAKVRFAWDDYPVCNLVNGEGLPCGPFELALH